MPFNALCLIYYFGMWSMAVGICAVEHCGAVEYYYFLKFGKLQNEVIFCWFKTGCAYKDSKPVATQHKNYFFNGMTITVVLGLFHCYFVISKPKICLTKMWLTGNHF